MTLHWKNLLRLLLAFVLLSNAVATSVAMAGHHATMGEMAQADVASAKHHEHPAHTHESNAQAGHEHMGSMQHLHDHANQLQTQDDQAATHAANECCQVGACCAAVVTSYEFTLNQFRAPLLVEYDSSFEMVVLAGEIEPPRKLHV